ncbi:hypothetical protein ACOMHN_059306 [Nucella lapillus]
MAASQHVKKVCVPVGHILVSGRWRKTELVATLQKSVQIQYEDSLGVVDFHPASHIGVIYVSEADLVGCTGYRRRCAQLRMANKVQGVVMVEKTLTSGQYCGDMQRVAALEMGLTLLPVTSQDHAAGLLTQMVAAEGNPDSNPFKFNKWASVTNMDDAVLTSLQTVPGLGLVKAKQLLERFRSTDDL